MHQIGLKSMLADGISEIYMFAGGTPYAVSVWIHIYQRYSLIVSISFRKNLYMVSVKDLDSL